MLSKHWTIKACSSKDLESQIHQIDHLSHQIIHRA